jgi:hypothetical protein
MFPPNARVAKTGGQLEARGQLKRRAPKQRFDCIRIQKMAILRRSRALRWICVPKITLRFFAQKCVESRMAATYRAMRCGAVREQGGDAAQARNRYDFVKGAQKNAVLNTYA